MKTAFAVLALIIFALLLPFVIPGSKPGYQQEQSIGMPWEITTDATGNTTVFGLSPGTSTLAEVRQQFGDDLEIAIIATPDETGSLEAYYPQVSLGPILGRLIVTLDLPEKTIAEIRERALKAEHMESTTRKITLHPDDLALADRTPVRAISLIPNGNLDEEAIIQRFGEPAERIRIGETLTHFLYPKQGLDIVHDQKGKEILQYVAPKDFDRIRAPLESKPLVQER